MSNKHSQKTFYPQSQGPSSQKVIRSRNAAETRAALLAAARVRFARDGYEATNLRNIAADVGVNVALISRYFGSKEGLFQPVIAFDLILEKVVFYEELHDGKAACRRLRSISGGI